MGESMKEKNHFIQFKKLKELLILFLFLGFICLLVFSPDLCYEGIAKGILLCGRVVIPSLFPFSVCVLVVIKSGVLKYFEFLNRFTTRLFSLSAEMFFIMLLSFIGGYPLGAKLLNEAVKENKISSKTGSIMLNFCINAGPAFIISAVGIRILNSKNLGIILFSAHILSSLIICFICRFKMRNEKIIIKTEKTNKTMPFTENFVLSAQEAASAVFTICTFVILFSCIGAYINPFKYLKIFSFLLEVTNAVTLTRNIYVTAFLLGFSGVCIWFQVFSVGNRLEIKILPFIFFRLLHALFSSALTFILLKVFNVTIPTLSNNIAFTNKLLYSTPAVAISLLAMCIVLIISLTQKKYTGKILEDMV